MVDSVTMDFHARGKFLRSIPVRALDDVSITLAGGENLALVGESGSGKTTLARICLRLIKPTTGRVLFQGKDITNVGEQSLKSFRRRVQAIFQDPFSSLDPYMDVGQLLDEPLSIHHLYSKAERRKQAVKSLEEVKLVPVERFVHNFPHMLSGGQRQRVAIARALILEPDLLVADEPVSMIDASSRAEILYLLATLQETRGIAVLYITHDIATARHFSNRTAVMYLGRVVEQGPTTRVITNPLHPYTQALLQAVPEPDPANRHRMRPTIMGDAPNPTNIPEGCRFHTRCPHSIPGRCDVVDPILKQLHSRHFVACHLYE